MHSETLRAWVEIDVGALLQNAVTLRSRATVPLLPMVKADAYGLGAERVVKVLEQANPWGFGVATLDEGISLRQSGVQRRIIVFTPALEREFAELRAQQLTPALGQREAIRAWCKVPGHPWHLAIETGMNRAGAHWTTVAKLHDLLIAAPPEGAFTHFHSAEKDDGSMQHQEERFVTTVAALPARPQVLHAENSAAIARHSRSQWDMVRPGIFLYGVGSGTAAGIQPRPVVALRARIVELHDIPAGDTVSYHATYRADGVRKIATTALGYADGYRRLFSNSGWAMLNGKRVPVAGIVTMDMTMLDVTGVECAVGDTASFLGSGGADGLIVEEAALAAGMSPYELLTGLRARLPRVYRGIAGIGE